MYQTSNRQECIPVGCVLSATVAVASGGPPQCMLSYQFPPDQSAPPPEQTPPEQTPHGSRHPRSRHPRNRHPQSRHPPEQSPPGSRHPPGSRPPPGPGTPRRGQTDACENIAFTPSLRTVKLFDFERAHLKLVSDYSP